MKKLLLVVVLPWLIVAGLIFGQQLYWVAFDKDYYGWPAVTCCRVCTKTVWVWQSYSRRPIPVEVSQPDGVGIVVSCSMTGLMHDDCKGPVPAAKVEVTVGQ